MPLLFYNLTQALYTKLFFLLGILWIIDAIQVQLPHCKKNTFLQLYNYRVPLCDLLLVRFFSLQGVSSQFSVGLQLEENASILVLYKLAEALNILR